MFTVDIISLGRGFGPPSARLLPGRSLAPVCDHSHLRGTPEGVFHRHGRSALGGHLVLLLGRINPRGNHLRVTDSWLTLVQDRLSPARGLRSFRLV